MSRTTRFTALRPLAGAGLIAGAALLWPAAAHAQTTPEAALVSRLAPTVFVPNALALGAAGFPVEPAGVNGERALLGQTPVVPERDQEAAQDEAAPASVDGGYALLGRPGPLDPRRRTVPAASR